MPSGIFTKSIPTGYGARRLIIVKPTAVHSLLTIRDHTAYAETSEGGKSSTVKTVYRTNS